METFSATRVEVLSNRPQPREVDGDVIAPGPLLRVVLRPAALTLCVPAPTDVQSLPSPPGPEGGPTASAAGSGRTGPGR